MATMRNEAMNGKRRMITVFIYNLVLVVLAAIGAGISIHNDGSLAASMIYYTQDSNLLLGVASAIYAGAALRAICRKKYEIPAWVQSLKYIAVSCIAVTFIVVLCIFIPMAIPYGMAGWILFDGAKLFQHTLSPLAAIAGFLLLEHHPEIKFSTTFLALIPTAVYAAVLYPLNIARIVDGPYPFLQVHNLGPVWSVIWFFIILAVSCLAAFLVWGINRKLARKNRR